jgi:integrase
VLSHQIEDKMAKAQTLTLAIIKQAFAAGPPPGAAHTMLWDNKPLGLGLKIRASSSCAWVYCYRPKGAGRKEPSRTITLGTWPSVALNAARTAATTKAGEVANNKDPALELREARNRTKKTVAAAVEGYAASIQRRKLVDAPNIESSLRRNLAPLWSKEIDKLKRPDFVALVEALETAGKPGAATNLRRFLHALLEWSRGQGLVPYNELAGMRRPRSSRAERLDENRRIGRALADDEIRAIWMASDVLGPFGGLIRLGVLSGMRRDELAGLKWSDVRDDRIVLEAHVTKTGAKHEIPMTPTMRALFNAQPRTSSPLVFPSPRTGKEMAGWSKLAPRAVRESGVTFRLHDLRRTTRTLMSRLGVSEEIAELAIGHVRRGLVATYNKDTAWQARTDAFERVSAHVAQLVSGGAPETGEADKNRVVALGARR